MALTPRAMSEALAMSSSSSDYQKKMAKAMRVRSERHDQELLALKQEQNVQLDELKNEYARISEAEERRHTDELDRLKVESISNLDAVVYQTKREMEEECSREVEETKRQLEDEHAARLSMIINQHQEALAGMADQHQQDTRERMAMIAIQKDELNEAAKRLALQEAASRWEAETERRVYQVEMQLRNEHAQELESVRRECEVALRDLAAQHSQERQRLGGSMLDQREETRTITAQSEREKSLKRLGELRVELAAQHAAEIKAVQAEAESKVARERARGENFKEAALKAQEENHKQVVASLEASLAAAKAEYDRSLLDNMTHSGRIVERLEAERDRLIAERSSIFAVLPFSTGASTTVAFMGVALFGLLFAYIGFMFFEYRAWLFHAYSIDRRFT